MSAGYPGYEVGIVGLASLQHFLYHHGCREDISHTMVQLDHVTLVNDKIADKSSKLVCFISSYS